MCLGIMENGCGSICLWVVLGLLGSTTLAVSWATDAHGKVAFAENVQRECSSTRYPNMCMDTLLARQELGSLGHDDHAARLVSLLVERTRGETMLPIYSQLPTPNHHHQLEGVMSAQTQEAIDYCAELMQMSLKRLNQSLKSLKVSPRESKHDIQTWLSAVLTFQDACKDSVSDVSGLLASQISSKMDHLSVLASNSLALANRIPGGGGGATPTSTKPPRRLLASEEEAFPRWAVPSAKDRKLLQSTEIILQAHAVVAQDGSGNYSTISDALESVPTAGEGGGRYVIFMKAGVYKEKFTVSQDNVMLVGEGKDLTIITNGGSVNGGSSMPSSATVVVTGDRFLAKDIGFQNSAGPSGQQALALRIASDQAALYRCSIQGYQDTLYAVALRQFYRECDIHGTIDFVFGNAAAVFQSCDFILRRPSSGGYNAILANGRSDPGQNTGFAAQNSRIFAGSDLYSVRHSVESYLGRPWKEYSRAVIMQSSIDDSIQSKGWVEWSGGFALKTLYFAEYLNSGPGAGTSGRVQWPGFHLLGADEASKFTVSNFIAGSSWLPSMGVIYDPGL